MDEYKKAIDESEKGLSALIIPDIFSLTHHLPNEKILLTDQTTVILSNIEITEKLFFVLLEKTKVTIGEWFSITEHVDSEDCIREHSKARRSPFCLERSYGMVSNLTLENIERMAPKSIGCSLEEVKLYNTCLINILPKLRINEDCKVKRLELSGREKEHVATILSQKQVICVGSVGTMTLKEYAVSILPKLIIHEGHEIELLELAATEKEHVAAILAQDKSFCDGRVRNINLEEYAVFIFLRMKKVGESPERLMLFVDGDDVWRKIQEELKKEKTAICIEEVEDLILKKHAVNNLPALKTKREIDLFFFGCKQ
ncbi:MAG: uncharacterized protein A8A55_2016 [Amphiamblys sp. WSBS2006]|nr:MAG: uncharacterized protein A8A55_2016 [Amphiamblys sp. WSBS2006]